MCPVFVQRQRSNKSGNLVQGYSLELYSCDSVENVHLKTIQVFLSQMDDNEIC